MTKGDRAYGKFQVMGANIPAWTKEALGTPMTPDQFLADPKAQDAVFQYKFGQYVDKYGPEGAAKAWFAGEKGMNNPNAKDVLGTSVAEYGSKFMKGLGGAPSAPLSMPPMAPQAAPAPPQQFFGMQGQPQAQQPQEAIPQAGAPPGLAAMPMMGLQRRPYDPNHFKTQMARFARA